MTGDRLGVHGSSVRVHVTIRPRGREEHTVNDYEETVQRIKITQDLLNSVNTSVPPSGVRVTVEYPVSPSVKIDGVEYTVIRASRTVFAPSPDPDDDDNTPFTEVEGWGYELRADGKRKQNRYAYWRPLPETIANHLLRFIELWDAARLPGVLCAQVYPDCVEFVGTPGDSDGQAALVYGSFTCSEVAHWVAPLPSRGEDPTGSSAV